MLKPSVGLISLVSSPLIFKTIVVFPELSRPLHAPQQHQSNLLFYTKKKKTTMAAAKIRYVLSGSRYVHHKNAHFFLFSLDLTNNAEKPHRLKPLFQPKRRQRELDGSSDKLRFRICIGEERGPTKDV